MKNVESRSGMMHTVLDDSHHQTQE